MRARRRSTRAAFAGRGRRNARGCARALATHVLRLYRGLAAVGAETGRLPDVLTRLADYLEARQVLKQKFTLALIYPALVTVIALAVIAVLLIYVVPQVVSVYQQSRQTLPWLTQALIAVSAFFRATGWFWVAGIVALVAAFAVANRRLAFRVWWHASLLRLPVAGRLVTAVDTARFASTLSILTGSGAPLLRALDAARDVVWALPLKRAADASAALVREGVSLARALKEQRVFPPVLIHLVANGEASGQLGADARPRGRRAGARGRATPHLGCRADPAGADRRDGRDRAGARAGGDAADRFDESVDPLVAGGDVWGATRDSMHNCRMQSTFLGAERGARFRRARRRFLALAMRCARRWPRLRRPRRARCRPISIRRATRPRISTRRCGSRKPRAASVLIEVGSDTCMPCRALDRFFTANSELKQLRDRNYVWLKVNSSKENANDAFLRRFPPVTGYPHLFVLDANGRLLHSQNIEALEGGKDYDPAAMRAFLVKWAPDK